MIKLLIQKQYSGISLEMSLFADFCIQSTLNIKCTMHVKDPISLDLVTEQLAYINFLSKVYPPIKRIRREGFGSKKEFE